MHLLYRSTRRLLQSVANSGTTVPPLLPNPVTSSGVLADLDVTESSAAAVSNTTSSNTTGGFFMNGDDDESGLSDMETVAIACVATLIPLCVILLFAYFVRSAWRKMHPEAVTGSPGGSTSGVLKRDESSDPTAVKSVVASTGHLLPEEMKTSESAFSVTPVDDARLEAPQLPLLGSTPGVPTSGPPSVAATSVGTPAGNHMSAKSANGSIITLTMQNNHLIVETEAPASDIEATLATSDAMSADSLDLESETTTTTSQQAAQIHEPPRTPSPPCLTGLSQSLSSLGTPSYCYGTQVGYPSATFGYPRSLGYQVHPTETRPPPIVPSRGHYPRLPMQLSIQDDNFAPSHHRTSSLPMRLARTQTVIETLPVKEVEEPSTGSVGNVNTSVAARGGGKYRARASLPIISPISTSVISKLSGDTPPPPASIAE